MNLRNALIFCAAALALSLVSDGFAVLIPVASAWLGVALAVRLRPSLMHLVSGRRLPDATEWAALAIGQGGAVISLIAVALVLSALNVALNRYYDSLGVIHWSLATVWAVASLSPLWARLRSPSTAGETPALAPCLAGLLGGAVLGLGLLLSSEALIEPLLKRLSPEAWLNVLMSVPACILLLTSGAVVTVQAFRGRKAVEVAARVVLDVLAATWAVLVVVFVSDLAGLTPPLFPRMSLGPGGGPAAIYAGVVAATWAVTLWRLRKLEVRRIAPACVSAVVLLATGVASVAAPSGVMGSGVWAELVAVFLFPVLAATVLFVGLAVVPMLRRLHRPAPLIAGLNRFGEPLPTVRSPR